MPEIGIFLVDSPIPATIQSHSNTRRDRQSHFGATGSKVPEEDINEMVKLPTLPSFALASKVARAKEGRANRA